MPRDIERGSVWTTYADRWCESRNLQTRVRRQHITLSPGARHRLAYNGARSAATEAVQRRARVDVPKAGCQYNLNRRSWKRVGSTTASARSKYIIFTSGPVSFPVTSSLKPHLTAQIASVHRRILEWASSNDCADWLRLTPHGTLAGECDFHELRQRPSLLSIVPRILFLSAFYFLLDARIPVFILYCRSSSPPLTATPMTLVL